MSYCDEEGIRAVSGMRLMGKLTHVADDDTTTYAEGYGDHVLVTTLDNTGRQLVQLVIKADDARRLVNILGSKLNET
jgi:hypothetical protein